ncbi:MAG: hypothetical protein HF982_03560 [Desulfobacteraceae bacterium]|nr:hypothetical protein [Desulfobacteraceae bacterium]MBC2718663.1 hypothetical protein [Desulfobacteraceae bacterium]
MKFYYLKTQILIVIAVCFLFSFASLIAGCSFLPAIKRIACDIKAPAGNLKKKVGITFFENRTFCAVNNFEKIFHIKLAEKIKETCPNILIIKPGDTGYPDQMVVPPRLASGRIDNLVLAKTGRKFGLNAIVTGSLIDISGNKENRGILWFKNTYNFIRFQIVVGVYDTETGAKIFDDSFVHEIKVDELDLNNLGIGDTNAIPALTDSLLNASIPIGKKICDAVNIQPWKGYVISSFDDKIIISSGKRSGLILGDKLEVYDSESIFEGKDGQKFFIPGLKIEEIKITALYPDRAEATPISGKNIKVGSTVKIK